MSRRADRRRSTALRPGLARTPVGVYAGAGASHSWTWLVDCLEAQGVPDIRLVDEADPALGTLEGLSVLLVGGGDPQAMAAGMGMAGARALKRFVQGGGLYVGLCAGAYLPIPIDLPVMDGFAMTGIRLGNVVEELPPLRALASKAATEYGPRYVLHPAREGIVARCAPTELGWPAEIEMPLYGGAPMILGPEEEALAHFERFTPRTLFLVDEEVAARILLGAVAACRRRLGEGEMYLFAPHLENPHYRAGHPLLVRLLEEKARPRPEHPRREASPPSAATGGPPSAADLDRLMKNASEARIVAFALEFHDLEWRLGEKYYDPAKIVALLDTVWRRLADGAAALTAAHADELADELGEVVTILKAIKRDAAASVDTLPAARRLFPLLSAAARRFVQSYLETRAARMVATAA